MWLLRVRVLISLILFYQHAWVTATFETPNYRPKHLVGHSEMVKIGRETLAECLPAVPCKEVR
ncbi:MAG: hypothetical protein DMG41_27630 [Acidobacteria bacterium]|nr:MAG: hypothetical protein AUH13_28365 [Acidobacteria bacterium 13_2_20CM_58_27]PYT84346.1 MAG: hypothetical protein DMG41_27630 [Acidobacteriota bacterium]